MGANLAGKEFLEAVIVGDGRDGGNVGGQGDGRERGTLPFIPPDELGGEVGRIRGTAAVAEEQYFVTVSKGCGDYLHDLHDAIDMFARELLLDGRAFGKRTQYM